MLDTAVLHCGFQFYSVLKTAFYLSCWHCVETHCCICVALEQGSSTGGTAIIIYSQIFVGKQTELS